MPLVQDEAGVFSDAGSGIGLVAVERQLKAPAQLMWEEGDDELHLSGSTGAL